MFNVIEERTVELAALTAELWPEEAKPKHSARQQTTVALDMQAIMLKMFASQQGKQIEALYRGDISGYDSHSEADLAFMNHAAFWFDRNPQAMDTFMRDSDLMRDKWLRDDYRDNTIQTAISQCKTTYQDYVQRRQTAWQAGKQPTGGYERPLIILDDAKLHENVKKAHDAMVAANKSNEYTKIYQRGNHLVRTGRELPRAGKRQGITRIYIVTVHYLQYHLTKIARFQKWNERKQEYVDCACPKKIADILLEMPGEYCVYPLRGITNAPTLRMDGSTLEQPGYDEATCIFFDPCGEHFPPVPQNPTRAEALQAAGKLLYILGEFPFKSEDDRSVAIAFLLTPLVRRNLPTAPGTAFDAPTMGTGKTRLANLASHIAFGHVADNISYPHDEIEMNKRIFALLFEGAGVIVLDNLEQPLASETLCTVLTEPTYKGRILGKSQMESVSTNATWAVTGNNLTLKGDITTRFLLCQLDARMERPEERTFKLNLDEYIPAHRAELVIAGLTVLRAHHLAADKPQLKPYGRFEAWSHIVRSAVVWCGLPDPLNTRKVIDANDPVREALKAVLNAWYDCFSDTPQLVKDAIDPKIASSDLVNALYDACSYRGELTNKSVGKWIARYKEDRINMLRFVELGGNKNGKLWAVKSG